MLRVEGRGSGGRRAHVHGAAVLDMVFDHAAGAGRKRLGEVSLAGSASPATFDPGAVRPARIGTLKKFVRYLQEHGLVDRDADLRSIDVQRSIQKYAYIAEGMGTRLGYDFDFLESGAISTEMSLDLYRLDLAMGGAEPFGGNAPASEAFLRLVGGRGRMWIRVATFVVRTIGTIRDVDEFVKYMGREGPMYDKRTVRSAFEHIHSLAASGGHGR